MLTTAAAVCASTAAVGCMHAYMEGGRGRSTTVDADLSLLCSALLCCTPPYLGIFEGTNRELYASLFQGQLLAVAFSG